MPLPGPTDKKKHWQSIVLTPLVTPGTYNNACVTVNEYGLVTGISSCPTAAFIVVDVPGSLPGTGANGDLAVVLNEGDILESEGLYVYDDDGVHTGWRQLASTAAFLQRIDYRQGLVTIAPFTVLLPALVSGNEIVKSVTVEIITPYPPGTMYFVEDSGGPIYMDSTLGDLDPTTAGTYTIDLGGNAATVGGLNLQVRLGGGPPFGNSVAYVTYIN